MIILFGSTAPPASVTSSPSRSVCRDDAEGLDGSIDVCSDGQVSVRADAGYQPDAGIVKHPGSHPIDAAADEDPHPLVPEPVGQFQGMNPHHRDILGIFHDSIANGHEAKTLGRVQAGGDSLPEQGEGDLFDMCIHTIL